MTERPLPGMGLPTWLSEPVGRYLAHTVVGISIRTLARDAQTHASTVLRQVRRIESRRDDPLVDAALSALSAQITARISPPAQGRLAPEFNNKGAPDMTSQTDLSDDFPQTPAFEREACRVLRRLCETGAVLAVAEQMEKAVVVRDAGAGGAGARTAVVDQVTARSMALQDWIACANPGRISRYRITAAGRAALGRMIAADENQARAQQESGFAEAQTGFDGHADAATHHPGGVKARRASYNTAESPLTALARRKDRGGKPFLDADLVQAGERLREDFELSQMGPRVTQNWDKHLTSGTSNASFGGGPDGCIMARNRLSNAMSDLGQGLSDVALRCCCHLEGLEIAEKRMGWSARSGKIVLRIALQRLRAHYDQVSDVDRMIG